MTVDWKARAEREAAALLDGMGLGDAPPMNRGELISLLGVAWLQGTIFGNHETLAEVEQAFDRARAEL